MRLVASREEQLVDLALAATLAATPDEIRNMEPIRPQTMFGADVGPKEEWTLAQVMNIDRTTPTYRSWTSGSNVQPVPVYDRMWSGSLRNVSQTQGF